MGGRFDFGSLFRFVPGRGHHERQFAICASLEHAHRSRRGGKVDHDIHPGIEGKFWRDRDPDRPDPREFPTIAALLGMTGMVNRGREVQS